MTDKSQLRGIVGLSQAIHGLTVELFLAGGGVPTPAQQYLTEAMRTPVPGDLVVVFPRFDPDGVGFLVRVEFEFPQDRWVIEPLHRPDEEQGWRDATVIAVPWQRARQFLRGRAERVAAARGAGLVPRRPTC